MGINLVASGVIFGWQQVLSLQNMRLMVIVFFVNFFFVHF